LGVLKSNCNHSTKEIKKVISEVQRLTVFTKLGLFCGISNTTKIPNKGKVIKDNKIEGYSNILRLNL
jgi:hypothetical protein